MENINGCRNLIIAILIIIALLLICFSCKETIKEKPIIVHECDPVLMKNIEINSKAILKLSNQLLNDSILRHKKDSFFYNWLVKMYEGNNIMINYIGDIHCYFDTLTSQLDTFVRIEKKYNIINSYFIFENDTVRIDSLLKGFNN